MSSRKIVLQDGIALYGEALSPRPFKTLLLSDGVIEGFDGTTDSDACVLDLRGRVVLPGLIDCHVHFDLAAAPTAYRHWSRPSLTRSLTCLQNGLHALVNGITSVRDLGSADHAVLDYARAVEQDEIPGPRVIAAGRPITTTAGHFAEYGRVADGADEVRKAVREQIGAGASVIKIMVTGGISTPGNPQASQFTAEEIHAAVEEAHNRGLLVAAHAHSPAGVQAALVGGVDTIEHAAFVDETTLAGMVEAKVTLVPTVSALNHIEPGLGIPEATVTKSLAARETYRSATRRAIEAGVRIAAGTDAGTALNPIGGLVDELAMYAAFGMPLVEVLQSATAHAAPIVGGAVGVLEEGRLADLLIVDGDPRNDLEHLRHPRQVVTRGRLLDMKWAQQTIQQLKVS